MHDMRFYAIRKHIAYDFLLLVSFLYEVVSVRWQIDRWNGEEIRSKNMFLLHLPLEKR